MPALRNIAAALLISGTLAACGGSGHPVCTDDAAAQEYSRTFVTDMIAAAGRLKPETLRALQSEFDGIGGAPGDFAAFCTKLDTLRAKYAL